MILYILLPRCIHLDNNVFFNVLKNCVHKVGREKLTDNFLDIAFKEGMAGECQIDLNCGTAWSAHSSKQDKISQSILLGRWAIRNYPAFGKILFGDNWQPIHSNDADEVDKVVMPTMKCLLVELDVAESTLPKLRHFVKVTKKEISVENTKPLTEKTVTFDVKDNCMAKCWMSLKLCKWMGNTQEKVRKINYYINLF